MGLSKLSDVGIYLKSIPRSTLSAQEEKTLGLRIAAGDLEARQHFIESNLRLVVSIAKRYREIGARMGAPFIDLVFYGNLGLIDAVDGYDPSIGRFSTYASYRIKGSISRNLVNCEYFGGLSVPEVIREAAKLLERNIQEDEVTGRSTDNYESALGLAKKLPGRSSNTSSIERLLGLHGYQEPAEGPSYIDFLPSQEKSGQVANEEIIKMAEKILNGSDYSTLTMAEVSLLKDLFGLNGNPLSLREVAKMRSYGNRKMTREAVLKMRDRALDKLRDFLEQ